VVVVVVVVVVVSQDGGRGVKEQATRGTCYQGDAAGFAMGVVELSPPPADVMPP